MNSLFLTLMTLIITDYTGLKNLCLSLLPKASVSSEFHRKASSLFIILVLIFRISITSYGQNNIFFTSNDPTGFIENKGQIVDQNHNPNPKVLYLLNTPGMNVQLRKGGFNYDLYSISHEASGMSHENNTQGTGLRAQNIQELKSDIRHPASDIRFHRIDFDFIGYNPDYAVITEGPSADFLSYYTTGTPVEGVTGVRSYQSVIYKDIYPGIDLEFTCNDIGSFKYVFYIKPGGELQKIRLKIGGAEIKQTSQGFVKLITPFDTIEETIPESYFLINGIREPVTASFTSPGKDLIGISVTEKIPETAILIIDPLPIRIWGTYYGGSQRDNALSIKTDQEGNLFIAGETQSSTNIATAGAFQTTLSGIQNGLLSKFTPDGVLVWGTYYGGEGYTWFDFCTISDDGSLYIVGQTNSTSVIATPGTYQSVYGGGANDGFLVKFSPNGTRIWGTYYGGSSDELAYSCIADGTVIYVCGYTTSSDQIASPGAFQSSLNGPRDAWLAKFDSTGQRIWGTYFGGALMDHGLAVNVMDHTKLLLGGNTESTDVIATTGTQQVLYGGGPGDGFLEMFDTSGQRIWGTYVGGTGSDGLSPTCLTDTSGYIYLFGHTSSTDNIATPGSHQPSFGGGSEDGFISKFDTMGLRKWGTYYGGEGTDVNGGAMIDDSSYIFITGRTSSLNNIATPDAYQYYPGGNTEAYLVKFSTSGNRIWGTYYGGGNVDVGNDAAVTGDFQYLTGHTLSTDSIATPVSHQSEFAGVWDGFIVKFTDCPLPDIPSPIIGPTDVCGNTTGVVYEVTAIGYALNYTWDLPPGVSIVNGQNTNVITVDFSPGATSGYISVRGENTCGTGDSTSVFVTVTVPDSVSVQITGSANNVCEGTTVTFTATPIHGGSAPGYQWMVNGINQGIDNPIFTYSPADNDTVNCILTSLDTVCISNNPATSNEIVMNVYPYLPVSISISTSENPICEGEAAIFTASTLKKGNLPVFQWFVNGNAAGINDSIYTYIPSEGDQVYCVLTSSEQCTTNNPVFSNTIIMVVNLLLPVEISITASANPVCEGLPITFTATSTNGGTLPTYQWQVNGVNTGTNSPIFTYIPTNNDMVTCTLTSSEPCTSSNPASSNPVIVTVLQAPEVTFTPCFDTITTTNAKPIRLRGGIPLGGTYSGNGVNNGFFYPALAGSGIHQIIYSYINSAFCQANSLLSIINYQLSIHLCGNPFMDIRDSTVYPTVQIGSQCWFAENLIYGTEIPFATPQRDNCKAEKYVNQATSNEPRATSYQWDELMTYTEEEALQGLCPPGWHVPSEADWNQLFAFYQNNAFAGSPLKYTGYSGFNAFLNGTVFFNRDWYLQDFATFFWSSTSHGPLKAWAHGMNEYNYSVSFYPAFRANAFSVRCLRD